MPACRGCGGRAAQRERRHRRRAGPYRLHQEHAGGRRRDRRRPARDRRRRRRDAADARAPGDPRPAGRARGAGGALPRSTAPRTPIGSTWSNWTSTTCWTATRFGGAPVVRVSAVTGAGLDDLRRDAGRVLAGSCRRGATGRGRGCPSTASSASAGSAPSSPARSATALCAWATRWRSCPAACRPRIAGCRHTSARSDAGSRAAGWPST